MAIHEDMMQSLAACKPVCPKWGSKDGCKKGSRCRFSHDIPDPNADPFSVPYTDTRVAEDELRKITVRVPLTEALGQFFEENRTIVLG